MTRSSPWHPLLSSTLCVCLSACGTLGPRWRAVETTSGAEVDLVHMADALAGVDVVFLGEEHDNDVGHELQLELTKLLLERRGTLAVSLEMFERDVQDQIDLYLMQAISEERFLGHSRPWSNYREHYRAVIELARAQGLPVIAANCRRALASRVAGRGLTAVAGDAWCAAQVDAWPGPYRDRFVEAMGDHAQQMGTKLDDFFASQCLKDDTMAESIVRFLEEAGEDAPLVVHWCGRFHSDYYLGTVERLLARRPDLTVAVVTTVPTMRRGRDLTGSERASADYVWLVPPGGR